MADFTLAFISSPGNFTLIQRIRLQGNRSLNLDGPGAYSCGGCQKSISVEPIFQRLLDWTLEDLKERLDSCYQMLSWCLEDIRMFLNSAPTIGRVALVEQYRSTLNELAYVKDDNSRLFDDNQRVREALEKSIGEARKYQKCYNGLLGLSRKLLECPVCLLKPFTLVLPCGHSLCLSCAEMLKRDDERTKCGICSRPDFYMISFNGLF